MKENAFTKKWKVGSNKSLTEEHNKILQEAYECIEKQLWDKKSSFLPVAQASIMARKLRINHWLRMDEIHQHVFLKFWEDKKHETFDRGKASLYTYTGYHTHLEIRDFIKEQNKAKGEESTFLYCVLDDDSNPHWYTDSLPKSVVKKNNWKPLLKSQSPLLDRLTEIESPEDILIKKEFWNLVWAHYDEIDIMVLLGKMKKTEASAELQINYDAYCKRLKRKNDSFRIIANKAGHC